MISKYVIDVIVLIYKSRSDPKTLKKSQISEISSFDSIIVGSTHNEHKQIAITNIS